MHNISAEQRAEFNQLFTAQQLADKLKQDVLALAAPLVPQLTREQLEELLQSEEYTRYVCRARAATSTHAAPVSCSGAHSAA